MDEKKKEVEVIETECEKKEKYENYRMEEGKRSWNWRRKEIKKIQKKKMKEKVMNTAGKETETE